MSSTPDDLRRLDRRRSDEASREAKQRLWKVLVKSFFQKFAASSATVLDLDCGFGEFPKPLSCGPLSGACPLFCRRFLLCTTTP